MINHARTLLLNQSSGNSSKFEEYISSNFIPTNELPEYILAIRNCLFGHKPTRSAKNLRIRQLLSIVHSGRYDEYLRSFDSRITYLPWKCDNAEGIKLPSLPDSINNVSKTINDFYHTFFHGLPEFELLWKSNLFTDKVIGLTLALVYNLEGLLNVVEKHQVLAVARDRLPEH